MSTNNHEVWANGNIPLFLANPAQSITLSPTGTGSNVVLTNSNGVFLVNGEPQGDVTDWSLYPAQSNTIKMDASNTITNVGNNLYFNGSLIANASDIQDIGDWSLYNAVSDVNLSNLSSNYSIVGAKNITAISNVSAGTLTSSGAVSGTIGTFTTRIVSPVHSNTGNIAVTCTSNLTLSATSNLYSTSATISNSFNNIYTIAGNRGSDYSDFCYTTLSNKGGKGGQINLVADAGSVEISGTTYGVGGLINITANSPLTVPYNATSAIKLSAASILSYAGAVTPVGSLAGYNYIQGTLGVNIIAGGASSVPNTPGTNYLWGVNGTKIQNTLYVDQIVNYPGSNLNIHPDSGQAVDMTRVQFIGMGGASNANLAYPVIRGTGNAVIYGFSNIDVSNVSAVSVRAESLKDINTINNALLGDGFAFADISITSYRKNTGIITPVYTNYNINLTSSSNINLNTQNGGQVLVNGSAIDAVGSWASYPASQNVDFSNFAISNVASINSVAFSNIVRTPMSKDLDAGEFEVNNVGLLSGNSNFYITKDTANPLYIRNINFGGSIILAGGSNTSTLTIGESNFDLIAANSTLSLKGLANITMKSPVNMSNQAISNVPSVTNSAGTLTLQGTSVVMPCTLNMNNNPLINVTTINGGTLLTNPLQATFNVNNNILSNVGSIVGSSISFSATYPIVMNQQLNMSNNGISNVGALTGVTTVNARALMYNPSIVQLDMAGFNIINSGNITSSNAFLDISNTVGGITLTSPTSITEYAGSALSVKAGGSLALPTHQILMSASTSPMYISSSNTISLNSPSNLSVNAAGIDMVNHPITNLSTLNGHNLYQVGSWCSTSTSAIASNTPTPVAFDTQLITPVGSLSYSGSSNYFSATTSGNYLVTATLQISSSAGGGVTVPLYAWIQTAGNVDLANSGRHIDIDGGHTGELVLTATLTDPIAFRIMVASSANNCSFTTLPAITSPYARPQIPAATINITLIS